MSWYSITLYYVLLNSILTDDAVLQYRLKAATIVGYCIALHVQTITTSTTTSTIVFTY